MVDQTDELTQSEKINILIAEYNSLRAELAGRIGVLYQIPTIGFAGLSVVFLIGDIWVRMAVFIFGLMTVFGGSWLNIRGYIRVAERVRQLEQNINTRAGESLLEWESRHGSLVVGWLRLSRPLPGQPAQAPPKKSN